MPTQNSRSPEPKKADSDKNTILRRNSLAIGYLTSALDGLTEGVIISDPEGKVLFMNQAAEEMTEWPQDAAIDKSITAVFEKVNKKNLRSGVAGAKLPEGENSAANPSEVRIMSKGGIIRAVSFYTRPLFDNGLNIGSLLVFRDIKGERKLREFMFRNERFDAVSYFAAKVGHEFSNVVTGIMGSVCLAKLYARPGDKIFNKLEQVEKISLRAKGLLQDMLSLYSTMPINPQPVDLKQIIRTAAEDALASSPVEFVFATGNDLWNIEADPNKTYEVVFAIVKNSSEAMPAGGLLTIEVQNADIITGIKEGDIPLPFGKYVKIVIADQGRGIPEENLSKIFDPYFTTKKDGGLGLTRAYEIVSKHKGYIDAESKLGHGTTMTIYLPAHERQDNPAEEA